MRMDRSIWATWLARTFGVRPLNAGATTRVLKWTSSDVSTSALAPGIPASIRRLISSAEGITGQGRRSLYFVKR